MTYEKLMKNHPLVHVDREKLGGKCPTGPYDTLVSPIHCGSLNSDQSVRLMTKDATIGPASNKTKPMIQGRMKR